MTSVSEYQFDSLKVDYLHHRVLYYFFFVHPCNYPTTFVRTIINSSLLQSPIRFLFSLILITLIFLFIARFAIYLKRVSAVLFCSTDL